MKLKDKNGYLTEMGHNFRREADIWFKNILRIYDGEELSDIWFILTCSLNDTIEKKRLNKLE